MTPASGHLIRFESFEIDPRRGELRNGGKVVPVEPQVLDLLALLASDPGRVFSRDEIIDGIWGGRIVSDSAISTRINAVRQAVGDDGKSQRVIRTVPRRGFMFVPDTDIGEVVVADKILEGNPHALPLPDKPSVVVLPFVNLSGDPKQGYYSDGIADDIITDLCRYDELFVIARQSAFTYRDQSREISEIAGELGVQHVLEGSVRRAGDQVRVTVKLTDAAAGRHIWAERFDRDVGDLFAVQDEITGVIVNTLVGQVTRRHHKLVVSGGAEAVNAYDHALKAAELIWTFSPRDTLMARVEAEQAVAIDPEFARAHALLAMTYITEGANGWGTDAAISLDLALKHSLQAAAADDREPWAHCALAWTHIWRDRAHDRGIEEMRLTLKLNPTNAFFRSVLAWALVWAGKPKDALQEIDTAMRLDPHYPGLYLLFRGRALFHLGRYDEALPQLERSAAAMPGHANALALLAACLAALERAQEAQPIVEQIRVASPDFTVGYVRENMPYANSDDLDLFCQMLSRAGLTE
jgi:TolB-like protein/Tfp pilus assembly protein PilF